MSSLPPAMDRLEQRMLALQRDVQAGTRRVERALTICLVRGQGNDRLTPLVSMIDGGAIPSFPKTPHDLELLDDDQVTLILTHLLGDSAQDVPQDPDQRLSYVRLAIGL